MKNHPLADAFPLMEGEPFDELVADIRDHGLHHPVTLFEGMILDGRNRWRACQQLNIPHTEVRYTGDDPVAFVVSENLRRRMLSPRQAALAAERLATVKRGAPLGNKRAAKTEPAFAGSVPESEHYVSIPEAAALTGASTATVERVRQVRTHGVPAVVAALETGEMSPWTASQLSRKPPEEQQQIMDSTPIQKVAAAVSPPRSKPPVASGPEAASPGTTGARRRASTGYTPLYQMAAQMDPRRHGLGVVKVVLKHWQENRGAVPELDPGELSVFLADLKQARQNLSTLIHLIEKETER